MALIATTVQVWTARFGVAVGGGGRIVSRADALNQMPMALRMIVGPALTIG